jgi:hypothetical protein
MNSTHKYKFYKKQDEFKYNPSKEIYSFYQICSFKHPYTNKYGVRKVIFNEFGNIVKTYEKEYHKDKIEAFIKNNKKNKYTMYSVYDIKTVALPGPSYILEAKSDLLNNNYDGDYMEF